MFFRLNVLFFLFNPFFVCAQTITTTNLTSKSLEYIALAREKEGQGDKRQASHYFNEAASLEWERKNYNASIELYENSLRLNQQVGNVSGMNGIYNNLGMIYHDKGEYKTALDYFQKNLTGRRAGGDKVSIISSLINISVVQNNLQQHQNAIKSIEEALNIAREMGDSQQMRSCYGMLAETYEKIGDSKNMLRYFDLYRSFHEKVQGDRDKAHKTEMETARLQANNLELEKRNKELELEKKEFELKKKEQTIENQSQKQLKLLSSLDKNQLIIRYLQQDSINKANVVKFHELQAKEAKERHEAQRQRSRLIQTSLIIGLSLLALLMGILLLRYREKRKTNKQLAEQKEAIDQERQKADTLLFSILPKETANELKETGGAKPHLYEKVTVLFSDFQGFTQIASKMQPEELVQELNFCFSGFDEICKEYGLEKIKTIGDAYMCAGGIPISNDSNPKDAVRAAMAMVEWMKNWAAMKEIKNEPVWHIRIGIHTGSVVAGVIGSYKFAYDIWGDAVNLASRMESAGEAERINISEATYQLIKDEFVCSYRGKINAKGKGEVDMYFVEGMKD
jgi:class 3 adenylate cyclase